jgi:hypothetical protein
LTYQSYADLDAAKQHVQELGGSNPFPELKSLDMQDAETLDYIFQREQFEREFPSGKARQPVKHDEWAKPTSKTKSFTSTPETSTNTLESAEVASASTEEVKGDAVTEEESTASPTKKSILDKIELDDSERKLLEEFRAQRERKRGGSSKK